MREFSPRGKGCRRGMAGSTGHPSQVEHSVADGRWRERMTGRGHVVQRCGPKGQAIAESADAAGSVPTLLIGSIRHDFRAPSRSRCEWFILRVFLDVLLRRTPRNETNVASSAIRQHPTFSAGPTTTRDCVISTPSFTKGSPRARVHLLDLPPAESDLEARPFIFPKPVRSTRSVGCEPVRIYYIPLDEGGLRCGKEPSGVFPPLQSVAGGLVETFQCVVDLHISYKLISTDRIYPRSDDRPRAIETSTSRSKDPRNHSMRQRVSAGIEGGGSALNAR